MVDRLLLLQDRGRPLINGGRAAASEIMRNEALKKEIDALYKYYFGRAITGCKNCYADALIELCAIKKATAMDKTNLFVVRRGKVLKDTITNDARLNLVRGNETEGLALYHLYTNPNSRQHFENLPDDDRLAEMLVEYGEKFEAGRNARFGRASSGVDADKIINDAKDKAAEIEAKADEIRTELAKQVEIANETAQRLVEEATDKAKQIVAKAEETAAEIVAKAKETAAEIVAKAEETAAEIAGANTKAMRAKPKKDEGDPILA